jgi:hypothetical protein
MENVVFIMPSVIYFSGGPLSYSETRSIYSPEQRAVQTKNGIDSIREKIPTAKIVLSEVGLKKDLPLSLEKLADKYVYGGANTAVRRAVDSPNKGHGEAVALILADKAIRSFSGQYFFKLSGRYKLNEKFDLTKWTGYRDCLTGLTGNVCGQRSIGTGLYGWPSELHETWCSTIFKAIPDLRFGWAMEHMVPKFFPAKIRHLSPIGLWGLIGPNGCGVIV